MTKPDPSVRADDLLKTSATGVVELQEDALDRVAGGNNAKTADKAYNAVDAYIRG